MPTTNDAPPDEVDPEDARRAPRHAQTRTEAVLGARKTTSQSRATTGSPSMPDVPDAPVAEEMTPDGDAKSNPGLSRIARLGLDQKPVEPHLTAIGADSDKADRFPRDLTQFAIIARLLFKNAKNATIVTTLGDAGYPMSERTLQRILRRSDFLDYYEQYRANLLAPQDAQIRDDFRAAMPEAFNHLVKMMRSAKSEQVRIRAIELVMEGGGGLKRAKDEKQAINVPPELQKALVEAGKRFAATVEVAARLTTDAATAAPPADDSKPS